MFHLLAYSPNGELDHLLLLSQVHYREVELEVERSAGLRMEPVWDTGTEYVSFTCHTTMLTPPTRFPKIQTKAGVSTVSQQFKTPVCSWHLC